MRQTMKAEDVPIGVSAGKVAFAETDTEVVLNRLVMPKERLATICHCKSDERCWAVAMSVSAWPHKLRICPKSGQSGHEAHDSSQHAFKMEELKEIAALVKSEKVRQGLK